MGKIGAKAASRSHSKAASQPKMHHPRPKISMMGAVDSQTQLDMKQVWMERGSTNTKLAKYHTKHTFFGKV